MGRHILVAMETTASSEAALEFALQEYPDSRITVLHVLESSDPLGLFGRPEPGEYLVPHLDEELLPDPGWFERGQCRKAKEVFDRSRQIADEHGREIDLATKSGKTAPKIAEYAENNAIDYIVIGDRNYRGVSRALFGNIAASIGRRTSIPVTIIC